MWQRSCRRCGRRSSIVPTGMIGAKRVGASSRRPLPGRSWHAAHCRSTSISLEARRIIKEDAGMLRVGRPWAIERWLQRSLPLLVATVMLAGGFYMRWANVTFPGPERQDVYNDYA